MRGEGELSRLPEAERNALLRRIDWRFLLDVAEPPLALDLRGGEEGEALRLVSRPAAEGSGAADLVVIGFPRRRPLSRAREELRPGGWVVCGWRLPMPGASSRARKRLSTAGFRDARVYWPGPLPHRPPQFWLPLDSPAAQSHLLASRPAGSWLRRLLRPLWSGLARLGLLAPVYAVARAPGAAAEGTEDGDLDRILGTAAAITLLTGGRRSINKVVGLAFVPGGHRPELVVKLARVPEAEGGLEREAEVLERLQRERPELGGAPRLLARGRRAGAPGIVETAIQGRPLLDSLTPEAFPDLAARVTRFLIQLAGRPTPLPPAEWGHRLLEQPLDRLERQFGPVLPAGAAGRARRLLAGLGPLPLVCEHRDCAPWNIVLTAGGAPALLDWESAEPRGLPGLDLIYFLSNSVFVLEGALEAGRTREAYAGMLDPASPYGRAASACSVEYMDAVGLDAGAFSQLRTLCWVVHCASDYRHLELESAGPPSGSSLRTSVFLGLLEEELGGENGS
jgi:phosphotransferase family enzyme